MFFFWVLHLKVQILLMCYGKKNTKLLIVAIIVIIGLVFLWLIWRYYDIQLTEIENRIEKVKTN